jgi:hypothetical protein
MAWVAKVVLRATVALQETKEQKVLLVIQVIQATMVLVEKVELQEMVV